MSRSTGTLTLTASILLAVLCGLPSSASLPAPPDGFVWEPNEAFSDEFDGTKLDDKKWHNHHPRWKGRPPARFMPESVAVEDGALQISNSVLDPPQGEFTIVGGAVVSKSAEAHYGYYEVRMKASRISMSSTFWFSNQGKETNGGSTSQELDVQEAVGAGKLHPERKYFMKSNAHYWYREGGEKTSNATPGDARITPASGEAFHVYGAWWVDANTIKFYHNDQYKFTIHPSTKFDDTPFDRPMQMNMVTETYDWETPPTPDELGDDSINTTYYDWVRSYVLVKKK